MITNLLSVILAAPPVPPVPGPSGGPAKVPLDSYTDVRNPALGDLMTRFLGVGGGKSFIASLINLLINLAFVAGGVIFFFMLITGAIAFMTSGGDKTSLEDARNRIKNAMLGMFLLLSAWAVVNLVENIFDVELMTLAIPTL